MSIKRVLLVDDSKSARFALGRMLQKLGLEVDAADSGEAALEFLAGQHPDAIFLDHQMPGMDGFETVEAIKAKPDWTQIPVVMCTSKDEEQADYREQAAARGVVDVLSKSASPERVQEVLQHLAEAAPAEAAPAEAAPAASGLDRAAIEQIARETAEQVISEVVAKQVKSALDAELPGLQQQLEAGVAGRAREAAEQVIGETLPKQLKAALEAELPGIQQQLGAAVEAQAREVAQNAASEAARGQAETTAQQVAKQTVADKVETEAQRIAMVEAREAVKQAGSEQWTQLREQGDKLAELQQQTQDLSDQLDNRARQAAKGLVDADIVPQLNALSTQLQEELKAVGEQLQQRPQLDATLQAEIEQSAKTQAQTAAQEVGKSVTEQAQRTARTAAAEAVAEQLSSAKDQSKTPTVIAVGAALLSVAALIVAVVL